MENLVIDTTPKGSAILAYGTSQGLRRPGTLLAIIAGSVLVIAFLALWIYVYLGSIFLPENPVFLIAMKPKTIQSKLPPPLLQDLPPAWRTALQNGSASPVILGYAKGKRDEKVFFAMIPSALFSKELPGLFVKREMFFTILTDRNDYAHEPFHLRALLGLILRLKKHDASWQLQSAALNELALRTNESNDIVTGTWDGDHGLVNIKPDAVDTPPAFHADLAVSLTGNREEAEPVIDALLAQGIDIRGITAPPSTIGVSASSTSYVRWQNPLTSEDDLLALGAFGKTTTTETILPDGTVAYTIFPVSASSDRDGTFSNNDTYMPVFDVNGSPDCPGVLRLRVADTILDHVLDSWGFSEKWQIAIQSFEIRSSAIVCARIETNNLKK